MFLIYLDSSGSPNFKDKENYVLASVIINESYWEYIDNNIQEIKRKRFPNLLDSEIEIHVKYMTSKKGIYEKMTWEQIYTVLEDIFNFITDYNTNLTLIAVLIDKSIMEKDQDIETWAYTLLYERINRYIEKENNRRILDWNTQYGITIIDTAGSKKSDQKLFTKLFPMLKKGTFFSDLEYLIEEPLFTDSKWRNLSQIADCVAYCIRKKFRTSKNITFHDKHWDRFFNKIKKKLDRGRDGQYMGCGLKIFPEDERT